MTWRMNETFVPREGAFLSTGNWTREQTILAFHFYCQTAFGQLHAKNKKLIALAGLIGRTPGSLAMKCVNIASLDPAIRDSGRAGLSNASAMDREIWGQFHADWEGLLEQAEELRAYLLRADRTAPSNDKEESDELDFTGETRAVLVRRRVKQEFFRRSVLSCYGGRCCISGTSDSRFLVASHIVAWSDDASIRLNPANGLCLSTIHDRAFDNHLFSLTDDHRIILSTQLRDSKDRFLRSVFFGLDDKQITLPERFVPAPRFLTRHRSLLQS